MNKLHGIIAAMNTIQEHFRGPLGPHWRALQVGGGQVIVQEEGLRLALPTTHSNAYADAQLDDYSGLPRHAFPWRPPLRLDVRARTSGALHGTAGFGFWNNPFSPLGGIPALPAALWFFHGSPPADMPLALGVPGHGWKAATIDATTPTALAWSPLALPVALLNNVPALEQRIWPRVQRSLCIAESLLPPLDDAWHNYTLDWQRDGARFSVDGATVLETERVPQGPLGFVAWVDNQWMVATPRGRFGWGLLDADPQWLDLGSVAIKHIPD